jgi:hypothetical protein
MAQKSPSPIGATEVRRFFLQRHEDETGVSGTGRVAEGVLFSTGWVALTWLTSVNSLVFYPSITNVQVIHGHNGKTDLVWIDAEDTS